MKKILLLFSFLLLPFSASATINYNLELNLDPAGQDLLATAQIDLHRETSTPLSLQLSQRCEILSVRQGDIPIPYQFRSGVLQLQPSGPESISISYSGIFNDQVSDSPLHNEDPGYGVSASIGEKGSYLSAGTGWYPQLSGEDIEYRISISTPSDTKAVTSGRRIAQQTVDNRSISVWLVDYPVRGLTLSAGPYQVFEDLTGPVPVYAYFSAENAPLAATYLQEAHNYLQLYTKLFGPYPYHKFAIVENFFPTGFGLPSWTLLGSSVIKLPFIVKTSLGHEIAHSWWGVGVQVDYGQGNWSEGLTTYVADYLYKERSSMEEAHEYRQNILRDYANLVDDKNATPLKNFSSRFDKASQAIGYGKAAFLFHMLRKRVGDEIFWRGLRQLAQERMHTRVGWNDFNQLFSNLSGQDLQPFFDQWLNRKTGPQLELQAVEKVCTEHGWMVSGRLTQQPVYQLEIKLQLICDKETLEQWITLNRSSQTFKFNTSCRPLKIQADPEADLFRILAAEEIPATINSIRGSNSLLVLRGEKSVPNSNAITTLLGGLRKSELAVHSLSDLSQKKLASHDLLIFGLSENLLPQQILSLKNDGYWFDGERLNPSAQSAFMVSASPWNPTRSAAWFISDDQKATLVARKIPHYGKYSYLLFNGPENDRKGVFIPKESPLKKDLN